MKNLLIPLLILYSSQVFAQLGFCEGSKGDPIFHEDFGTGDSSGPALPSSVTNYTYYVGDPEDGGYTISNRIGDNLDSWHTFLPETTISNGRALIVNADFNSGRFYRTRISGLCENSPYEFSAFLMNIYNRSVNICPNGGIPVDVRFEIWDETDSFLLKEGSTGEIHSTSSPRWEQYAMTFKSQAGQDAVILKMYNNAPGGCGNDLAIDDIIFRSCGDLTEITSNDGTGSPYRVCEEDVPVSLTLTASPDNSVYSRHAFQWQESSDSENWSNIPGETEANLFIPEIFSSRYFRVKVAEDQVNVNYDLCSSASEAFFVEVQDTPASPQSDGDVIICSDQEIQPLQVVVPTGVIVTWYDAAQGGNIVEENSVTYLPETEGTYYAEASRNGSNCISRVRTEVSLIINEVPDTQDEILHLCNGTSLTLSAGAGNMQYLWSTGENTESIVITTPGTYNVTITNEAGCSGIKSFEVKEVATPIISEIISEGDNVIIRTGQPGEFEYSLNGVNFQTSNRFSSVPGGFYTAYVRDLQRCETVSMTFPHIVVPKFITPNGDGYNDAFQVQGLDQFKGSEIRIFDRYGKLLKAGKGENFTWNGTFNGRDLPADDYWYEVIITDYPRLRGHFSLIR